MDNFLVDEKLYKLYSLLFCIMAYKEYRLITKNIGVLDFFFPSPLELIAMPSMNNSVDVSDSESESLAWNLHFK